MEHREACERHESAEQDIAAVNAKHLEDWRGLQLMLFEKRAELLGHDEAQARKEGHDVDGEGDEERIAPAPGEEIFV